MRIPAAIGVLLCCCTGLAACTATALKGPHTAVTTPHVGKPPPPSSVQAALSRDPLTPYVLLGTANNDGLAPNESSSALAGACMTAAGFSNAGSQVPLGFRIDPGLGISQPWGEWGYLGGAEAEQYGFRVPPGNTLANLGIDAPGLGGNPAALPQAEQTALGKCATIIMNFTNAQQKASLSLIQALGYDIGNDLVHDPEIRNATKAWSACMSRNGFSYSDPGAVFRAAIQTMYGGGKGHINLGAPVSDSANRTQLAMATADANCTQSTDLAGIYFAVQASYEQQLVNANQQALTAAVHRYRTAYQQELRHLTKLLRTAKAIPFPAGKVRRAGR